MCITVCVYLRRPITTSSSNPSLLISSDGFDDDVVTGLISSDGFDDDVVTGLCKLTQTACSKV